MMSEQSQKKLEEKQKDVRIPVTGPTCSSCTSAIKQALESLPGYKAARYQFTISIPQNAKCDIKLHWLDASQAQTDLELIKQSIENAGFEVGAPSSDSVMYRLYLPLDQKVTSKQLKKYLIQQKASFPDFVLLPMQDEHSLGLMTSNPTTFIRTLQQEPRWKKAKIGLWRSQESFEPPKVTIYFVRALVNLAISVPLMIWGMCGSIGFTASLILGALTLGLMIWSGRDFYKDAWQQFKRKKTNMNTLFSIGSISAWIASMIMTLFPGFLGAMGMHVHFCAVMMIAAVVNLGRGLREWLIHRAKEQVSADVRSPSQRFAQLQPLWVERKLANGFEKIIVTQVMPGDIIRVLPGARIPVDGQITYGSGYVETDHQGQAFGKHVTIDTAQAEVLAGETLKHTYQEAPWIEVTASKRGDEGHLFQFYDTLESCGQTERSHALIDKLTRWFVPGVLGFAVLSMGIWALIPGVTIGFVISIGLAILLCACPCSFALAAPISQAIAAKKLMDANLVVPNVEDISQLQLKKGDILVLDKTGTLTEAAPTVDEPNLNGTLAAEEKLAIAALENGLGHWAAASLCKQWSSAEISALAVLNKTISPNGLAGEVQAKRYLIGSESFLRAQGIALPQDLTAWKQAQATQGKSYVFVAVDGQYRAAIPFQSKILDETTKTCIAEYQSQGVRVILLTGDDYNSARWCAEQVGIENIAENVMADQTPTSKKDCIQALQTANPKARVVMIGDGRNDAAALKQASQQGIGVGVGEGPDCRLAANILLPDGKLSRLKQLVKIYRLLQDNILSNLKIAIIYNTASLILAAGILFPLGYMLSPLLAAVAMGVSSVLVIANAMRLGGQIDRAQGLKPIATSAKRPWLRIAAITCCIAALSFIFAIGCASMCGMPLAMAFTMMAFSSSAMCACCIASLAGYASLAVMSISLFIHSVERMWQDYQARRADHAKRYQQLYDATSLAASESIVAPISDFSIPVVQQHADPTQSDLSTVHLTEGPLCLLNNKM